MVSNITSVAQARAIQWDTGHNPNTVLYMYLNHYTKVIYGLVEVQVLYTVLGSTQKFS